MLLHLQSTAQVQDVVKQDEQGCAQCQRQWPVYALQSLYQAPNPKRPSAGTAETLASYTWQRPDLSIKFKEPHLVKLPTLGEQPSRQRGGAGRNIKAQPTLAIFLAICSPLMAGMSGAVEACTCEGKPDAEDCS